MRTLLSKLSVILLLLPAVASQAQERDIVDPGPISKALVYTITPDYRKCASPTCGGYWLTPVNKLSIQIPTLYEAEGDYAPIPKPVYVASIDFSKVGLNKDEIEKYKGYIGLGRALIKGILSPYKPVLDDQYLQVLTANKTWISANEQPALGTYLEVRSSGIMCITTPCPYYEGQQINTFWSFLFHELTFDLAALSEKQLINAHSLIAKDSLVISGTRFASQGMAGEGLGIASTQVYFPFPH